VAGWGSKRELLKLPPLIVVALVLRAVRRIHPLIDLGSSHRSIRGDVVLATSDTLAAVAAWLRGEIDASRLRPLSDRAAHFSMTAAKTSAAKDDAARAACSKISTTSKSKAVARETVRAAKVAKTSSNVVFAVARVASAALGASNDDLAAVVKAATSALNYVRLVSNDAAEAARADFDRAIVIGNEESSVSEVDVGDDGPFGVLWPMLVPEWFASRSSQLGRAIERRLTASRGATSACRDEMGDVQVPDSEVGPPLFAVAWNPDVLHEDEYAELVDILADLAQAAGGAGVRRIIDEDVGVVGCEVLQP